MLRAVGGRLDPAKPTPPKPTYMGDTYTVDQLLNFFSYMLIVDSILVPDYKMILDFQTDLTTAGIHIEVLMLA